MCAHWRTLVEERARLPRQLDLRERPEIQVERMDRLPQVVAGGREEARFGEVGGLRRFLLGGELGRPRSTFSKRSRIVSTNMRLNCTRDHSTTMPRVASPIAKEICTAPPVEREADHRRQRSRAP